MKKISSLFIPLLAVMALGCNGKVTGLVFMDANGNHMQDPGEKGLKGAVFTVSKDGVLLTSGVTDVLGMYEIPLTTPGQYCVKVKKSSQAVPVQTTPGTAQSPTLGGATPSGGVSKNVFAAGPDSASNEDNKEDASGNDTSGTTPSPASGNTQTDKPASQATGQGSNASPQVIKSMEGCDNSKSFSVNLDIPVVKEYALTLPTSLPIKVKAGESFILSVHYPKSCILQPVILPPLLERPGGAGRPGASASASLLQFSQSADPSLVVPAVNFTQDDIAVQSLVLKAKDNVPEESNEVSLEPQALCPDDTLMPLLKQSVTITKVTDVDFALGLVGGEIVQGGEVTVRVNLHNYNRQSYKGVKLSVPLPALTSLSGAVPSYCDNQGSRLYCRFDLQSEEQKVFSFRFRLPDRLDEDTAFSVEGTLEIPDVTTPLKSEVEFALSVEE